MIRKICLIAGFSILIGLQSHAQDSLMVLVWDDYINWIKAYHPVARQAELQPEFGREEIRAARGNFDPLLYGDWYKKNFRETNYYNVQNAGIFIPTGSGVDFDINYETNTGVFLNPERTVPTSGLVSAGLSVNLGQGLLMDPQRAGLRQAQIFAEATLAEREIILNRLYLDGNVAYWNWLRTYLDRETIREGLELAESRFEFVKKSYQQGEFPALDTLEAFTQVQNRRYQLLEMERRFFEAGQMLSNFLWDAEGRPVHLFETTIPTGMPDDLFESLDKTDIRNQALRHPELRSIGFELETLDIERRLRAESLRPILRFKYNFLLENIDDASENLGFFRNDYQYGLQFAFPLFLRNARGRLNMTKLRLQETSLVQDNRQVEILNRLEAEFFSYEQYIRQINEFSQNVSALQGLLRGERRRFEVGESSLFIINARENMLIDARIIMNELLTGIEIANARIRWAAGMGFE